MRRKTAFFVKKQKIKYHHKRQQHRNYVAFRKKSAYYIAVYNKHYKGKHGEHAFYFKQKLCRLFFKSENKNKQYAQKTKQIRERRKTQKILRLPRIAHMLGKPPKSKKNKGKSVYKRYMFFQIKSIPNLIKIFQSTKYFTINCKKNQEKCKKGVEKSEVL